MPGSRSHGRGGNTGAPSSDARPAPGQGPAWAMGPAASTSSSPSRSKRVPPADNGVRIRARMANGGRAGRDVLRSPRGGLPRRGGGGGGGPGRRGRVARGGPPRARRGAARDDGQLDPLAAAEPGGQEQQRVGGRETEALDEGSTAAGEAQHRAEIHAVGDHADRVRRDAQKPGRLLLSVHRDRDVTGTRQRAGEGGPRARRGPPGGRGSRR